MATVEHHLAAKLGSYTRTGGQIPRPTQLERHENIRTSAIHGSHMPIDTEIHWTWRNPLNILPALVLVMVAIGIVGTILTLM